MKGLYKILVQFSKEVQKCVCVCMYFLYAYNMFYKVVQVSFLEQFIL